LLATAAAAAEVGIAQLTKTLNASFILKEFQTFKPLFLSSSFFGSHNSINQASTI
jgi:hypothetical protein